MKKIVINDQTPCGFPLVYWSEYSFTPNQFVLLDWHDLFSGETIIIPAIISEVRDDAINGYICKVNILNKLKDGSISGTIEMNIVVHKYVSSVDIEEKHYNVIQSMVDNPKHIFYVEKSGDKYYKVYPFNKG